MISGIPETGNEDQDKEIVSSTMANLDCTDVLHKEVSRLDGLLTKSKRNVGNLQAAASTSVHAPKCNGLTF